ncbi:MAG: SpoIVB peptidase [Clostridia bacterium]
MCLSKTMGVVLSAALLVFNYSAPMRAVRDLPSSVRAYEGQDSIPLLEQAKRTWMIIGTDAVAVSARTDERLQNVADGTVTYRLFGTIPVKSVQIIRTEDIYLIPGGTAVGITIRTLGVLVVGLGTVDTEDGALSPGAAAGMQAGDVILEADGETILNADQLMHVTKASDGELPLVIERNGERIQTTIRLVRDSADQSLRIGLWVRDSTAGVGTLSFVDMETGWFAALGHPVSDIDTQSMLSVREGKIIPTEIVDVKIGQQGSPGELIGVFSITGPSLGKILVNTEYGIFGKTEQTYRNPLYQKIPMGYGSEAHTGAAQILATISDAGVTAFNCEIVRVNAQTSAATKGMVVEVTDERLLAATGGIVQGMSGCPIIQDGRLIGIVTHVFVNDPTRGYCVYTEWMRERILNAAF